MSEHIPVSRLEPHPLALRCASFCAGAERAAAEAALAESVRECGVKVPLAVAPKLDAGPGFWVLDGCARLEAARAAGLESVPCVGVEFADENAMGEEIFRLNAVRKPFTSSQRVMLWVDIHLGAVLESYTPKSGRKKISSNEPIFSVNGTAERLGVSHSDVAAAVELARCVNARLVPDARTGELRAADGEEAGRLDAVYGAVLHGSTPVRRWKAAFAGMGVGEGGSAVNYVRLGLRTVKSLRTVFTGWQEISPADRQPVLDILREALESAPDDVLHIIGNFVRKGK